MSMTEFSLRKMPYFHLISWCGIFVERHGFHIVSGESAQSNAETVPFHKILTQENKVK